MPGGASRGVHPDRASGGRGRRAQLPVRILRRAVAHVRSERREVVRGDRGCDLVGVDRRHLESCPGEGEGVAADSAAEIGDARQTGAADALGVPCGDPQSRRLLEAGAGEQHPLGEVAELRPCPGAQVGLTHDRRDEFGGVARSAQPRHGPGDLARRLDRPEGVEELESVGGEQGAQLGHLHPFSLGRAQLALALHECQLSA